MKWIKASERMPQEVGFYHVKTNAAEKDGGLDKGVATFCKEKNESHFNVLFPLMCDSKVKAPVVTEWLEE